jgi:uncharacterized membrane protein YjgN (DUF898 family)
MSDPSVEPTIPSVNAPAPVSGAARVLPFELRATGAEYFRIWIVNLLLTIVTLGIYSAWAKVRRLRYFYGNTFLDNSSFEYHGKPIAILKGRLIAVGAYAVFFLLAQFLPVVGIGILFIGFVFGLPWIVQRSRWFQMRMSSYRGLRFNFHGTYGGALAAYVGFAFVAVITFYLMLPRFLWGRVRYVLGNSSYGNVKFEFTTPLNRFYRFFYITVGLGLVLLIGFGVLAGLGGLLAGGAAASGGEGAQSNPLLGLFSLASIPAVLGFLILSLGLAGYYQKSFINESFGGLKLGPHQFHSKLQTWPLIGIYVTNLLLIVVTLGLYYPWAKVRQLRYQIENLSLEAQGDLDQFRATASQGTDAIGEEIGDFMDIDFGL